MTLYDERQEVFERRTGVIPMAMTSFALLLLGAQFATLSLGLADALISWRRGATLEVWLYAPLADSPSLLGGSFAAMASGAALVVASILGLTWPADRALSSILAAYCFALAILTFAAMVVAFEPQRFSALAAKTGVDNTLWSGALILIASIAAIAIERRMVEVLARVVSLDSPGQRFGWWAVRLLPGFGVLALGCWMNEYMFGVLAIAITLFVTLLENLWRTPRPRHAEPRKPLMREAAATLPLLTAALIAASIFFFGFESAGFPPKVVAVSPKNRSVESKLATTPPDKPVIDIRWSKQDEEKQDGETGGRGDGENK